MNNVEMTVDENILTIKVDLSKEFGPSGSGKTIIIATTPDFELGLCLPSRFGRDYRVTEEIHCCR